MTLMEQIQNDIKDAMKSKQEVALSALRMMKAALMNKEVAKGEVLTTEESQAVLKTMVKQYKEALAEFETAGRTDLAQKQAEEIRIVESFLPAQLSDAELSAIVEKVVAAAGDQKDLNKLMGVVMKEVAGRADGNRVRTRLQERLS